jgi:hypothetical protein
MSKKKLMDYKMTTAMEAVCRVAGVTQDEIISKSRVRHLTEARRAYVNILIKDGNYTYMKIGDSINRHHATVLHNKDNHSFLYEIDKDYKLLYDNCFNRYKGEAEELEEVVDSVSRNKELRVKVSELNEEIKRLKKEHVDTVKRLENKNKDLDYTILKLERQHKMDYYSIR